jgi:uncharacterized protein with PQ loop repeat
MEDVDMLESLVQEPKDNISSYYLTLSEKIFILSSFLTISFVQMYFYFKLTGFIILANIIAWITAILFIISRIPQILLNYRRKSTDGLSIYSFVFLNIANYLFLASILVNICDIKNEENINMFMINNLQWIIGPIITSFLDFFIFYQFVIYT